MAIEREIDDAGSTRDVGASGKRKEDQSSSRSGKKQKASSSRGFQGRGRDHKGQGQIKASSQSWQMTCYFCHHLGHMKRDFLKRQGSQGFGTAQSSHQWDKCGHSLFLLTPMGARGTSISPRGR